MNSAVETNCRKRSLSESNNEEEGAAATRNTPPQTDEEEYDEECSSNTRRRPRRKSITESVIGNAMTSSSSNVTNNVGKNERKARIIDLFKRINDKAYSKCITGGLLHLEDPDQAALDTLTSGSDMKDIELFATNDTAIGIHLSVLIGILHNQYQKLLRERKTMRKNKKMRGGVGTSDNESAEPSSETYAEEMAKFGPKAQCTIKEMKVHKMFLTRVKSVSRVFYENDCLLARLAVSSFVWLSADLRVRTQMFNFAISENCKSIDDVVNPPKDFQAPNDYECSQQACKNLIKIFIYMSSAFEEFAYSRFAESLNSNFYYQLCRETLDEMNLATAAGAAVAATSGAKTTTRLFNDRMFSKIHPYEPIVKKYYSHYVPIVADARERNSISNKLKIDQKTTLITILDKMDQESANSQYNGGGQSAIVVGNLENNGNSNGIGGSGDIRFANETEFLAVLSPFNFLKTIEISHVIHDGVKIRVSKSSDLIFDVYGISNQSSNSNIKNVENLGWLDRLALIGDLPHVTPVLMTGRELNALTETQYGMVAWIDQYNNERMKNVTIRRRKAVSKQQQQQQQQ